MRPKETQMKDGDSLRGPCLVLEEDATTVVPPGWTGKVDGMANILLEREGGRVTGA